MASLLVRQDAAGKGFVAKISKSPESRGGQVLMYIFDGEMHVNPFQIIAGVTTALILLFGVLGHGPSTYRFAILFLGPLLWFVYSLRKKWHIHPAAFAFFALAMLLHDLGAFGTYGHFYFNLEFDTYVHFAFGLAGGMITARALRFNFGLAGWKLWAGTALLILGLGAVHELIEVASTLVLGEKGMFKLNDPDKFDTQKDLANNLLGALVGLAAYTLARRFAGRRIARVAENGPEADGAGSGRTVITE
jgi:uncharacterized membrane protein YjdF